LTDNLKKLRGLGYSIFAQAKYGNTPTVANPAEDLVRHSAKKREDETNIPPKNSLPPPSR
jgi:hypothetical protein